MPTAPTQGKVNEIQDDGKRWNHSEEPNTSGENVGEGMDPESSYAKRDIKAGEEVRRVGCVALNSALRRGCAACAAARKWLRVVQNLTHLSDHLSLTRSCLTTTACTCTPSG